MVVNERPGHFGDVRAFAPWVVIARCLEYIGGPHSGHPAR
jgi:hypothetical protein